MKKQFSLLQLFSLVDGRLSTKIEDVYAMLDHICDDALMTHHLPTALNYVKMKNPTWFSEVDKRLNSIKALILTDDFEAMINYITEKAYDMYDIPQLKDEFDTSDFGTYMIENSLLLKIGSKVGA